MGRKRELFFVFGKFRNFFPILFSLNAIFFFFYANEREEFVDYLTYYYLGIPNLIRKMVMVKWIIGSFFSII